MKFSDDPDNQPGIDTEEAPVVRLRRRLCGKGKGEQRKKEEKYRAREGGSKPSVKQAHVSSKEGQVYLALRFLP